MLNSAAIEKSFIDYKIEVVRDLKAICKAYTGSYRTDFLGEPHRMMVALEDPFKKSSELMIIIQAEDVQVMCYINLDTGEVIAKDLYEIFCEIPEWEPETPEEWRYACGRLSDSKSKKRIEKIINKIKNVL